MQQTKGADAMLIVSKYGEIKLTRGDTARLTVTLTTEEGKAYEVQATDTLTLSVKKAVTDTEYVLQKVIEGSNTFHIEPKDTAGLSFGKYKYDVQLTTGGGDVYTVITPATFEIQSEVSC